MRCHCDTYVSLYYRGILSLDVLSQKVACCRTREKNEDGYAYPLGHTATHPHGVPEVDTPTFQGRTDIWIIKSSYSAVRHGFYKDRDSELQEEYE